MESAKETGNWAAQSFRLNDVGFKKSGEPLVRPSVLLKSVSLVKGSRNYEETTVGDLWLVVMTDYRSLNSAVLKSANKINVKDLEEGRLMTFRFSSMTRLSTTQTYWVRAVLDNGDGKLGPEDTLGVLRAKADVNTITGEAKGSRKGEIEDSAFDLAIRIEVSAQSGGSIDQRSSNVTKPLISVGGVTLGLSDAK